MSLPARIRVNATFPFPSLVQGSGPISIAKSGGIWTVGYSVASFAIQAPPPGNLATDYVLVYDSVAKAFINVALSSLGASGGTSRTQRSVTATPIVVGATDQILNCNIAALAACALPTAASRSGVPLTFKDLGQAAAHNITLTANGAEKIDGSSTYVLFNNYQTVTLVPFNDGVNAGWSVE